MGGQNSRILKKIAFRLQSTDQVCLNFREDKTTVQCSLPLALNLLEGARKSPIISNWNDTDNNAYHNSICRIKITDMLTVVTHKVENENLLCLLFVPQ